MLNIKRYVKATSLEEAYQLLLENRNNLILGGMMWLKMQDRNVNYAIDLSDLKLSDIVKTDTEIEIGAMTTLRKLETNALLKQYYGTYFQDCVKDIVGVQFRNMATIGGSVYGRFGFSDIVTALMAVNGEVEVYPHGRMRMQEFCARGYQKEIVTKIYLPKKQMHASFQCERRSATDFAVVNVAVCMMKDHYQIVIGARPKVGVCQQIDYDTLPKYADVKQKEAAITKVVEGVLFGDNLRGSALYRKKLAKVLIKRAMIACEEEKACK